MTPNNVLLVTIDSLRADHLPSFGNETVDANAIEGMMREGDSFRWAFTTGPGTTPSFPAMLTGTMPLSYGGLGPLRDDRPRLARELGKNGLATAGYHCNPFLSSYFNYELGFDQFEDYQNVLMGIATKIFPRGIELNNPMLRNIDEKLHLTDAIKTAYQIVAGKPRPYVRAEVITDDTVEWLQQLSTPFFCWTHYMDVHHPCYPPSEYRERYEVADVSQTEVSQMYSTLLTEPGSLSSEDLRILERLYDAAIEYVSDQLARILQTLRQTGVLDETLVIVTSDHGEMFGEFEQFGKPERMHDELLHVPLVVLNGPEYLGDATEDLVSLLDIPPLIHDALGLEIPKAYTGRCPGLDESRSYVLAEHQVEGDVVVGARSADWLYEVDEIHDERRLFTMHDGERKRMNTEGNDSGANLVKTAVSARIEDLDGVTGVSPVSLDEDVEQRLEDLGYR
ncbi:sulfatase [Haladaptatus sp. DFWS20]|uniref:sulfatase n=1 Tax=Haladaptatus sp. DFWS20 TaxID=3403467 RepID=UPI003EBC350F